MFSFLRFKKKADNYKPTQLAGVEPAGPKSVASASYTPEKPKKAPAKAETVGYVTPSRSDSYYESATMGAVYIPDTTDYTPSYVAPEPSYSGGGGDFGGGGSSGSWDSSPSYDSGSSSSYDSCSSSSSYDSGSSYSSSDSSSSCSSD